MMDEEALTQTIIGDNFDPLRDDVWEIRTQVRNQSTEFGVLELRMEDLEKSIEDGGVGRDSF